MEKAKKYHRAFGVYGICVEVGKLLVIHKNKGPYKNRFDLPGGSLEEAESLTQAMKREFLEETGFEIDIKENIGVIDFMLPWEWKQFTNVHHIASYYDVSIKGGTLINPDQFDGQDSLGALWVTEHEVSSDNASPLVLKAFEWIRSGQLGIDVELYEDWKIQ